MGCDERRQQRIDTDCEWRGITHAVLVLARAEARSRQQDEQRCQKNSSAASGDIDARSTRTCSPLVGCS
jgi:hypothetical protein